MLTNDDVKRLLDAATAGINKGEIALARTVCDGILAGRPDHAPTLITLALSHIAVGEYEKADAILKDRVLAANPDDQDARVYLGLSAKLSGRTEEAAEILQAVPADAGAYALAQALLADA